MRLPERAVSQRLRLMKAGVFLLAVLPLARLIVLGLLDRLGGNPVEFVIHSTGTWTLVLLLLTLTMTPLRRLTGMKWPLALRRMLGLFSFFYAVLHVLAYVGLDQWFDWPSIVADVAKHRYVLVGLAGFLLLFSLAVTSTSGMVRRLGRHWQRLHRLVYLAGGLGVVHYLWLVKKDITQPLLYGTVLVVLLAARIRPRGARIPTARRAAEVMTS